MNEENVYTVHPIAVCNFSNLLIKNKDIVGDIIKLMLFMSRKIMSGDNNNNDVGLHLNLSSVTS